MIKFAHRQNLKYPLLLLLWNVLLDIYGLLASDYLNKSGLLINLPLMFFGELFAGLLIYLYQKKYIAKTNKEKTLFMGIELIHREHIVVRDKTIKIFFLMFCASFFDFVEFKLFSVISKFLYISPTIEYRLKGWYTIFNALFYYFVLRLPILKNQKLTLIIIIICIIIIVITEFIFQKINIFLSYGQFVNMFIFILLIHFFSASI